MNITKKETEKNRIEYKKEKITEKDSARKKQIKILKIILAILAAGIIIWAIIYFIPVMKGLTTTEGKIAFKNKRSFKVVVALIKVRQPLFLGQLVKIY